MAASAYDINLCTKCNFAKNLNDSEFSESVFIQNFAEFMSQLSFICVNIVQNFWVIYFKIKTFPAYINVNLNKNFMQQLKLEFAKKRRDKQILMKTCDETPAL